MQLTKSYNQHNRDVFEHIGIQFDQNKVQPLKNYEQVSSLLSSIQTSNSDDSNLIRMMFLPFSPDVYIALVLDSQ